jgi:RNA polymerase sigma-70 factor (ECF subfamily)
LPTGTGSQRQRETLLAAAGGDERAFARLVEDHHAALARLARLWIRDRRVAEEAVQSTWIVALESIGRFERRSSLRTWLVAILANVARAAVRREGRSHVDRESDPFHPRGHRLAGHWVHPPDPWPTPEAAFAHKEIRAALQEAIGTLPPRQREVFLLRDVEQLSAEEVRNILGVTDTNQRVLLHRARSSLRARLAGFWHDEAGSR